MIDKRRRLGEKPMHSRVALPHHVWLIRAIELLFSLFYKKQSPDNLSHLKQWEREKVIKLGLASHSQHPKRSPTKDINVSSWDREKVSNFGLTESHTVKNTHRHHHLPKEKPTHQDQNLTPKISPTQTWKNQQNQSSLKNDNTIDDFFKILGYE